MCSKNRRTPTRQRKTAEPFQAPPALPGRRSHLSQVQSGLRLRTFTFEDWNEIVGELNDDGQPQYVVELKAVLLDLQEVVEIPRVPDIHKLEETISWVPNSQDPRGPWIQMPVLFAAAQWYHRPEILSREGDAEYDAYTWSL